MVTPKLNSKKQYEVRFRVGGIRHYKQFPEGISYQDAKKLADTFYQSFSSVPVTDPNIRPVLSTVFRIYLEVTSGMSERSKQIAGNYLKKFTSFFGDVSVEGISLLEIERYKTMRLNQTNYGKPTANATINRELSILLAATKKCHRLGVLKSNPLGGGVVERLKNNQNFEYFTKEEWATFIGVFDQKELILNDVKGNHKIYNSPPFRTEYLFNMERAADTFKLLLWTNSRLSEILKLKWSAVNLKTDKLVIHMGKVSAPKYQDITPELHSLLERLQGSTPDRAGYVLTRHDGKPFSTDQVEREFKTGLKLAGIAPRHGLTPHALRHTACSWLAMAGTSLQMMGATAGHRSLNSTMRYAHLSPSTLTPALKLLSEGQEKLSNGLTNEAGLKVVKN